MVQLSHLYMTTGKTIALTTWTSVSKVMSLLFNMLSGFVIVFLPRSKHLLISWLQSTICSDFGAQENKICHGYHFFPVCHEVMGPDAMAFVFWILTFKPDFSLLFSPSSRDSLVPLRFLPLFSGIICISEVFDISAHNFDSGLCFIQTRILHDVLCM